MLPKNQLMNTPTPVFNISTCMRGDANERAIDDAVKMIKEATRPLLLLGAGTNRKRIRESVAHFLDKTGIPFFNTQLGKGVVGGLHPLFLGTAALSDGDYLHCAIERADLIINVGHDVVEKPPFFMSHDEGATRVIHINFGSAVVDNVYFPQLEVVGDIANTIRRLADKTGKQTRTTLTTTCESANRSRNIFIWVKTTTAFQ